MDASGQSAATSPLQIYENRRDQLRSDFQSLDERDRRFAAARGLIFFVGVALAYFVWIAGSIAGYWLLLPILVFVGLVVAHGKVAAHRLRASGDWLLQRRTGSTR